MTTLVLIRHGETDWNVIGRYQGQADPPLNERGLQQAETLALNLTKLDLDVLISSPLQRTLQTAEIISAALGVPVKTDPRLMEIHQGDWQGSLRSEIERRYPVLFSRWETEPWSVTPPGGEHLDEVQDRVYAAVDDILVNFHEQTIGLVLHRIPIALLKVRYQGLKKDIVRTLVLPNTSWETIELEDPVP